MLEKYIFLLTINGFYGIICKKNNKKEISSMKRTDINDAQSLLEEYSKQTNETHNGEFFAYDKNDPYYKNTDGSCSGACCESCGNLCSTGDCCGDCCMSYCLCGC